MYLQVTSFFNYYTFCARHKLSYYINIDTFILYRKQYLGIKVSIVETTYSTMSLYRH